MFLHKTIVKGFSPRKTPTSVWVQPQKITLCLNFLQMSLIHSIVQKREPNKSMRLLAAPKIMVKIYNNCFLIYLWTNLHWTFFTGLDYPQLIKMNNPAFESNGSVSDADGIFSIDNHETSMTELISTTPTSVRDFLFPMNSSRSTSRPVSRRPSAFLSVDNSELNSHTYVYDSTRSLNQLTVIGFFNYTANTTIKYA